MDATQTLSCCDDSRDLTSTGVEMPNAFTDLHVVAEMTVTPASEADDNQEDEAPS